jgi:hypothetical protein
MILQMKGGWTHKDALNMEDNVEQERFLITDTYVRVKYRSADDISGWWKHPLNDQIKERNK